MKKIILLLLFSISIFAKEPTFKEMFFIEFENADPKPTKEELVLLRKSFNNVIKKRVISQLSNEQIFGYVLLEYCHLNKDEPCDGKFIQELISPEDAVSLETIMLNSYDQQLTKMGASKSDKVLAKSIMEKILSNNNFLNYTQSQVSKMIEDEFNKQRNKK